MKSFFVALLLLLATISNAQSINNSDSISGKFYVDLSSAAFFDNLEFANYIEKGYTLTGFNIEPRLRFAVDNKYSISAGFHGLFYSGEPTFTTIIPVVTINASLTEKISMNVGTINGANGHGLPEPIFAPERALINQPETGLQFLFNGNYFEGETWINWEKFLFFGDTIQEEFTVGVSGKIQLLEGDKLNLNIPLYALAVHQGGQINETESLVSTLANFGGGVNLSLPAANGRIGVEALAFMGKDMSPNPHHIYKNGWAIFPKLYFQRKGLSIDVGYWRADSLMLPRGQQIFGSVSTVHPDYNSPKREIVTGNFIYSKQVAKGFCLAGKVQLYQVVTESQLDFRFAVIAMFNEEFLLNWRRR